MQRLSLNMVSEHSSHACDDRITSWLALRLLYRALAVIPNRKTRVEQGQRSSTKISPKGPHHVAPLSQLAPREAVPGADKRSWDAGGGVDV